MGDFTTKTKADVKKLVLPQFSTRRNFNTTVHLFQNEKSQYDIVLGRDLLTRIGLVLDYKTKVFKWNKVSVAMKSPGHWTELTMENFFNNQR